MMGVSNGLLFDDLVQGSNSLLNSTRLLLPGLVSDCMCPVAVRMSSGKVPMNLTLVSNVLLEIVRVDQRQRRRWEASDYCP